MLIRKKIKTAMFSLARHHANIYLHCLNFLSPMIFSQIRFTAGETRSEFHQEQTPGLWGPGRARLGTMDAGQLRAGVWRGCLSV